MINPFSVESILLKIEFSFSQCRYVSAFLKLFSFKFYCADTFQQKLHIGNCNFNSEMINVILMNHPQSRSL